MLPPGKRLTGEEERHFFDEATPVPRGDVLEAIAAMYHGVVPAVLNADIYALNSSLKTLHDVGFKRRELDAQSDAVKRTYCRLSTTPGIAAGLSSLGPLVYAVADFRDLDAMESASRICADEGGVFLGAFSGRNRGYEISYE
jgi:beta-ribofuranosylaminobenzene 5'-phosphate synthase